MYKKLLAFIGSSGVLVARAQDATPTTGITGFLETIIKLLTGNIATSCATIAVIAIGYMAYSGRMPWQRSIVIIMGIIIIFSAAWIVGEVRGTTGPTS